MFHYLGDNLAKIFRKLNGKGVLKEEDINLAMREIRVALIESDVSLEAIKHLTGQIREKALGREVFASVTPSQMIVKIVNDELIRILKGDQEQSHQVNLSAVPPVVILMAGLQGVGKTTTAAKIALRLKQKHKKKVLLASTDVKRPAAQKQLEILAKQIDVDSLEIIPKEESFEIAKRALSYAKAHHYDVVIIDTAGRIAIEEDMMQELKILCDFLKPQEILLVADCMIGQGAANMAKEFNDMIKVTGIVLTKSEGDARGGGALSMKFVTGCPIKFLGTGEKLNDIEEFKPEGIVSRILGMGDVVSLVEKVGEVVDQKQSEQMMKKIAKGDFDMNDLLSQLKNMKKIGGLSSIIGMIPGFGKLKSNSEQLQYGEKIFKKQEAIICSMTKEERKNPKICNGSRKQRIARGAGVSVQDINKLMKQHLQMAGMMKQMRGMGASEMKKMGSRLMSGQYYEKK